MKKIYTLLFLIYLGNTFCQAQHVWSNFTNAGAIRQTGRAVATDSQGNVYSIGRFLNTIDADPGVAVHNITSLGYYDIYLSKYDANGNFIWSKNFGGTGEENPLSIVIDGSDNIYISGCFRATVDFDPGPGITSLTADGGNLYSTVCDAFISKFNTSGDFIWVRRIGAANIASDLSQESVKDIAVDAAGNIYALGNYEELAIDLDPGPGTVNLPAPPGAIQPNSFLVKLDANGNYINGIGIDVGSNSASPVTIEIKNTGVFVSTNGGSWTDPTAHGVSFVNKYDLNLSMQWSRLFGPNVTIVGMDVDDQGNVVFAGDFDDTGDFDPGPGVYNLTVPASVWPDEMFICKLDNNGIFQWVKPFELSYNELHTIKVNPLTGDIFMGGFIDNSGSQFFDTANPYSYISTPGSSPYAGFVVQFDGLGNFKSLYPLVGPGYGLAQPYSFFFDQSASLFVWGQISTEVDMDPSPQGVQLLNAGSVGGAFLTKWGIREPGVYYNTKANLSLENTGTWSTTPDGTGPSPQNFSDGQFNVINQVNANLSGVLSLTGFNSKLIIGDGTIPITLTVPAGSSYIEHTTSVDMLSNANLILQNNVVPALKLIADQTYVEFAQSGTTISDSIQIPPVRYYNLKLTGGLKNIDIGTTTVANDFIADAVANLGGTKVSNYTEEFCYLECLGNVTFMNGTAFEPESATARLRRFALKMNGAGPTQTITSNGTDIMLIGLLRTSANPTNVVLSPGTNIYLGAIYGGGFSFTSANAVFSCTGGSVNFRNNSCVSAYSDQGFINSNGTSFYISHDNSSYNYYLKQYAREGVLKFVAGSTINNLFMSCPTVTYFNGPMRIASDITVMGEIALDKGFVYMDNNSTMNLTTSTTFNPLYPGGNNSFLMGNISKTGASDFYFPVGDVQLNTGYINTKFAPVALSNLSSSNTYTVVYKRPGYAVRTVDPVTLQSNPAYGISGVEYWNITPTNPGGTADIRFYYKDVTSLILSPAAVTMAHFDGTDWNDIGGIQGGANNTTNGDVFVTGVSSFSPFTFGGTMNVVVPVKLTRFTATKQEQVVKLNWTTEQEFNSQSFVIERSFNQYEWDAIANVNAAGNSSEKINYNTNDFHPAKGINYYRLKTVDTDGRNTYSEIRPVYFGNDVNVVIAPNPAKDKITVYIPGNNSFASISIYDMNARLVKTINTNEESVQINLRGIAKGIYIFKINGKNISEVKKLLIQDE